MTAEANAPPIIGIRHPSSSELKKMIAATIRPKGQKKRSSFNPEVSMTGWSMIANTSNDSRIMHGITARSTVNTSWLTLRVDIDRTLTLPVESMRAASFRAWSKRFTGVAPASIFLTSSR